MEKRLTGLSAEELENFFLLQSQLFCDYRDPRRGPLEMLYLYGETEDNDPSTILRAIEFANAGGMNSIGIAEGELGHGYAGFDGTVSRLKAFGWKSKMPIVKLDSGGIASTLTEARALVAYARGTRGDIGIVASPFHLVRSFMTVATAIGDDPIRVYAFPGVPLRWNEDVVHSQGIHRNARAGLLSDELKRMEKYRASEYGSMLSAEKALKYLDWRDR